LLILKKRGKRLNLYYIFGSFLEKLDKDKRYVSVVDSAEVKNPNQTFKVFEEETFDEEIHMLEGISNILGLLFRRENPELE